MPEYDKMASLVDWMEAVGILSLDFSKAVMLPSMVSL